jgi:hypothetical protein
VLTEIFPLTGQKLHPNGSAQSEEQEPICRVAGLSPISEVARAAAGFFVSIAQGLNVMHKAVADRAVLKDAVRSRNERPASR